MRAALDTATDPWGIKVNRVELKNIMPPDITYMQKNRKEYPPCDSWILDAGDFLCKISYPLK